MVERRICTFCGSEIEPGTGRMYIKKDGVVYNFCTSKCFKNMVVLGRVPRRITWTRYYEREKDVRMKGLPTPTAEAPSPKARKVKKAAEGTEGPAKKPEEAKKPTPAPKEKEAEPEPAEKKPEKKTEKPAPKEAPKKEKPAPKKEEGAKKDAKPKPKAEPKPKSAEGAEE